ncbi:hypothetical protein [Vibrio europaeus]|uniref:hypothetical protein n=1 Tax=Vibrio europaeus TaxID=300876 RepID=UPI00233F4874|nr:hypothetical protein [Vibrio europaeus]MDC5753596.1 hypothetical protein [Vibrio europaeus]MDC5816491.1 hypothetical protein [Vibrio europaeus]
MANEMLKTFLAGYGIKKVSDIEGISRQSDQTLRHWHKNESKQALVKCCVLAYRFRLDRKQELNQEFDSKGLKSLGDYLEAHGYEMKQFERISNQSYQTLSNWFLNPKKSYLISIIKDALEWTEQGGSTEPKGKEIKSFSLERVLKNRKGFKGKYY